MTAPAAPAPTRSPVVAMIGYTLRTCLPGRRWIGVLLPCLAAILFGLLVHAIDGPADVQFTRVASGALFGLVLPVTCLVVGDAVLGAEIRGGTFSFTWLSPVPTWQIAVGRWAGGSLVACSSLSLAFGSAAIVAGAPEHAARVAFAAAFGAMAYVAIFIAIGCVTRRAAVWSLAYVFLVERLLGAALSGIAQLSPGWEARSAFVGFVGGPADLLRDGVPEGAAAVMRLALITAAGIAIAAVRLSHLRIGGSSD